MTTNGEQIAPKQPNDQEEAQAEYTLFYRNTVVDQAIRTLTRCENNILIEDLDTIAEKVKMATPIAIVLGTEFSCEQLKSLLYNNFLTLRILNLYNGDCSKYMTKSGAVFDKRVKIMSVADVYDCVPRKDGALELFLMEKILCFIDPTRESILHKEDEPVNNEAGRHLVQGLLLNNVAIDESITILLKASPLVRFDIEKQISLIGRVWIDTYKSVRLDMLREVVKADARKLTIAYADKSFNAVAVHTQFHDEALAVLEWGKASGASDADRFQIVILFVHWILDGVDGYRMNVIGEKDAVLKYATDAKYVVLESTMDNECVFFCTPTQAKALLPFI